MYAVVGALIFWKQDCVDFSLLHCSIVILFKNLIKPADNWWKVTYQEIPTRDSVLKGRIGTIKERYCHGSTKRYWGWWHWAPKTEGR